MPTPDLTQRPPLDPQERAPVRLVAGHPVLDPAQPVGQCPHTAALLRAVVWYDAGEAWWRDTEQHVSPTLGAMVVLARQ